jgi:predicted ATPase
MNNYQITNISIKGYKSIKDISLSLNDLNVFIGANGAGKSNLISLFTMLQSIIDGKFTLYVGENGVQTLLYNGRKVTPEMEVGFLFGNNGYGFSLIPSNGDRLIFSNEWFYWNMKGRYQLATGHAESVWKNGTKTQIDEYVKPILEKQKWRVYHFHDTGKSSPMKQVSSVNDNINMATDARNLSAFLYRVK